MLTTRATGVLLDISSLEIVDSFICRVLGETARVVNILGARVAIVGMRPAVAITLVELGLPLDGVATGRTLDHGFQLLAAPPADSTRAGGQRRDGRR
jgi:rsbT antagonist protein RsbS